MNAITKYPQFDHLISFLDTNSGMMGDKKVCVTKKSSSYSTELSLFLTACYRKKDFDEALDNLCSCEYSDDKLPVIVSCIIQNAFPKHALKFIQKKERVEHSISTPVLSNCYMQIVRAYSHNGKFQKAFDLLQNEDCLQDKALPQDEKEWKRAFVQAWTEHTVEVKKLSDQVSDKTVSSQDMADLEVVALFMKNLGDLFASFAELAVLVKQESKKTPLEKSKPCDGKRISTQKVNLLSCSPFKSLSRVIKHWLRMGQT